MNLFGVSELKERLNQTNLNNSHNIERIQALEAEVQQLKKDQYERDNIEPAEVGGWRFQILAPTKITGKVVMQKFQEQERKIRALMDYLNLEEFSTPATTGIRKKAQKK